MQSQAKLNRWDGILIVSLLALVCLYAVPGLSSSAHPAEDAAMLLRYSKHVAEGYGIVWNIGDEPIDGATDFLFMILVAAVIKVGLPPESASQLISFISHVLTIVIVYISIRKQHGSGYLAAFISALYIAFGPAIGYIQAYFGTPLFALFSCLTWYAAINLSRNAGSHFLPLLFALSGIILGLIRPEGVFLAAFMMLSVVFWNGWRNSWVAVSYFVMTFFVIGGIYFFWRWGYFGYPLPNPFYKKGGGRLYWDSLKASINNTVFLCFPFVLALAVGMLHRKTIRYAIFLLITVMGFVSMWVLLSNEMNYLMRFQYAIVPVILMSWPPLLDALWERLKTIKLRNINLHILFATVATVIMIGTIFIYFGLYNNATRLDGRYDVAILLNKYKNKNYTIATTEAGLLPFYSEWRAIDTWGLNDQWIAHNGKITDAYLERYKPEIIMFHKLSEQSDAWNSMITTLQDYAGKNGYHLVGVFGITPADTHYYYVRSDFPESTEIATKIQNMNYFWVKQKSINFAASRS